MGTRIVVVYRLRTGGVPVFLRAFKWEAQARDYIILHCHNYPRSLAMQDVILEDD